MLAYFILTNSMGMVTKQAPESSSTLLRKRTTQMAGCMRADLAAVGAPLLRFAARQGADAARLPFRGTLTPGGSLQAARAPAAPPPVWFVFPGGRPCAKPLFQPYFVKMSAVGFA